MRTPTAERLTDLLTPRRPPCISLYLPTSRGYPARQQDPVRYRNQLDAAILTCDNGACGSEGAADTVLSVVFRLADGE